MFGMFFEFIFYFRYTNVYNGSAFPVVLGRLNPWGKLKMQRAKQRRYSNGEAFVGLLCLLTVAFVLLQAAQALAAGCFPDLYYNAMFKPISQQSYEGGDTRLVGMSDYLAAKGEDPHDKGGSGCMCGVNNGRWDQMLLNRSNLDLVRAPVTFKINAISAKLFDREGHSLNTGFEIKPPRVSGCLDGALKSKSWTPWRLGRLAKPNILEPGENILGCVCLKPADRSKSGFVKLQVDYTPLALVHPVPGPKAKPEISGKRLELTDRHKLDPMSTGTGRYFRILPPVRKEWKLLAVDVELAQAKQLDVFTSPVWQDKQAQWQKGSLKAAALKPAGLWILVRAKGNAAEGELVVRLTYEFHGDSGQMVQYKPVPVKLEKVKVGPAATRTFKSYVLGMASRTNNAFDTATQRPCCDGMR
jgi:hypothetical protein